MLMPFLADYQLRTAKAFGLTSHCRRGNPMNRREFIAGLGSAAAWPMATRAQQATMPVVGFIDGGSADASADRVREFRKGLGERG